MYLTSQEHLLRLQTSIFNCLVDISTWMLRGHPEINKPKPELHPFFHVPLLSRALTSVKETDTHCQILGGHNTPHPFAPTSVSHSLLNVPQICHISPPLKAIIVSPADYCMLPGAVLSISTCSFPIGPSANLPQARHRSCHGTSLIPASPHQGTPLPLDFYSIPTSHSVFCGLLYVWILQ